MFQKGSYEFESQLATHVALQSNAERQRNAAKESDARDQMANDRREQQRLHLLRNLNALR